MLPPVPVIDLFAGPGGLGEGFSALGRSAGHPRFRIRLSIEKDALAHRTLELRAFFRQFPHGQAPEEYYQHLRGQLTRDELFARFPAQAGQARAEAWHLELGPDTAAVVRGRIADLLGGEDRWVLIGGPPCQQYSVVGRSRNRGRTDDVFIKRRDRRQALYVEYLQVIADHWPAVFVMENVKGLLSARREEQRIFEGIVADLRDPAAALEREGRFTPNGAEGHTYRLCALNEDANAHGEPDVEDFLVRAERHGVPQARHRLIIVGVRDGIAARPDPLPRQEPVPARRVLAGLPRLRSGVTRIPDHADAWLRVIQAGLDQQWFTSAHARAGNRAPELRRLLATTMKSLRAPGADRGAEFVRWRPKIGYAAEAAWFLDYRLGGVCNHRARAHMTTDLYRYLFAACFTKVCGYSPELRDFPDELLPDHKNVRIADTPPCFEDRFRVQVGGRPSTTVTSHIAKDGHYYIHYDPGQCRSLTVREAARLQTFPDNYFFCGNRTQQYTQVGNAVPPLLAREIARRVDALLTQASG